MTELINPKDKRFAEMKHINLSLTALGRVGLTPGKVIYTMSSNPKMLPPFRESALTRILKSMFLNNNKATIIVNLDPTAECIDESVNSIRFARYAKRVKTKITRREYHLSDSMAYKRSAYNLKEDNKGLKGRMQQSAPLRSTMRILRSEVKGKNLWATREREMMHFEYDQRMLKDVMEENIRLKREIKLLVERQSRPQKSSFMAGFNEEADSTKSEYDGLHHTM